MRVGVDEAKRIMMEHFADTARRFGLSELYGYIYGVLFFEDEPLSLGKIAERTGYSLSHVSTALKLLENIGLVKRIKKPGDKRAYYTAIKNIREWRKEAYYKKIEEDVRQTRKSLLKALEAIGDDESEEAVKIKERIEFSLQRNAITERIINIFLKNEEEKVLRVLLECLEEKLNTT
ncbi:MAG TPA: MarR family transcriptional regulator [Thermococcus sp.]|uniref:GbsR/MarR family transcriptional regulator n=1 Tax=Thermococcus sp. TaxID=35749 RepID=UPI000F0F130C|nr:MarR family transcriptional regulator [Thermococcus sp.]RLF82748.1 MAG: GbsR/MarR family transcriptional regulator [Thermococci archaeon]MCD6139889.1 MarR family transcriptional regulator [Thermococcus sp.]MCD6143600.1 MarR family transcriptional regulator [Thermococcus sp.]RLF85876.1 MAG: GbsR/MarR family transcriptional regulator [Thermococci archaeon]HDH44476.1 MarR family transcriptional regulator [Thermococcus sp.]